MTNSTNVNLYHPGLWNTNSYLASGIPYQTGSVISSSNFAVNNAEMRIDFPFITRSITIINKTSSDIRLHFKSIASGNVIGGRHYTTLTDTKDSITFNMKCKEMFISLASGSADGDFELIAELTNIPAREMIPLTGSGISV